jgi:hypothetical protein
MGSCLTIWVVFDTETTEGGIPYNNITFYSERDHEVCREESGEEGLREDERSAGIDAEPSRNDRHDTRNRRKIA